MVSACDKDWIDLDLAASLGVVAPSTREVAAPRFCRRQFYVEYCDQDVVALRECVVRSLYINRRQ
jgi:hypothetical protein